MVTPPALVKDCGESTRRVRLLNPCKCQARTRSLFGVFVQDVVLLIVSIIAIVIVQTTLILVSILRRESTTAV